MTSHCVVSIVLVISVVIIGINNNDTRAWNYKVGVGGLLGPGLGRGRVGERGNG